MCFFFFQAEDGIRDLTVTGVQTCALPISGFETPSAHGRGGDLTDSFAAAYTSEMQGVWLSLDAIFAIVGLVVGFVLYKWFSERKIGEARARAETLVREAERDADNRRKTADLDAKRSEEHTSELQSQSNLVCRLLLEKKKNR